MSGFIAAAVWVLLPSAAEDRDPPKSVMLPMKRIEGLDPTKTREAGNQTRFIGDAEAWALFWEKFGRGDAPEVDFKKSVVAVVFYRSSTLGYDFELVGVHCEPAKERMVLHVREYVPEPGTPQLQASHDFLHEAYIVPRKGGLLEVLHERRPIRESPSLPRLKG